MVGNEEGEGSFGGVDRNRSGGEGRGGEEERGRRREATMMVKIITNL